MVLGLLVGLVAGALVAGTTGYLIGRSAAKDPSEGSNPQLGVSLRPFESTRRALNKEKFSGDLAVLADPWLAWMDSCAANTDPDGPELPADEKSHIVCRYGAVYVHFAEYKSTATRDAARAYRHRLTLDAEELAPGMEKPARKQGGSSNAAGNYVEYAFRGPDERALCGIWWDRDDRPSASLYMETLCTESLGGEWEPLRDLWLRFS